MPSSTGTTTTRYLFHLGRLSLLCVLAMVFLLWPIWDAVLRGPLLWHFAQPTSVQGSLEAALLYGLMLLTLALPRVRLRGYALIALAWLYLRRHHVDLPLAICWLYLESILALGSRVLSRLAPQQGIPYAFGCALIVGLSLYVLVFALASGLGFGQPLTLSWILIIISALLLFLPGHRPLAFQWAGKFQRLDRFQAALVLPAVIWVMVLFARSNSVYDYDGLWYGYRGELVLAGSNGFFDQLGMVFPVFYFPKLLELLLLPLTPLKEFSVLTGMSILALVVLASAVHQVCKRLRIPFTWRWLLVLLVMTIPSVANLALEPKPDVLACALAFLCAAFLMEFLKLRQWSLLVWACASGLLACATKLTVVPFVAVMLLLALVAGIGRGGLSKPNHWRASLIPMALVLFAVLVLTWRTYWLTGVPTIGPDQLITLWQFLGFQVRPPAGTLAWVQQHDWSDVPFLPRDWLFQPSTMPKGIIKWVGNVWVWMPLAALLIASVARGRREFDWPWVAHPVLIVALTIGLTTGFQQRGGDGNYFMIALVLAVVTGGRWLASRAHGRPWAGLIQGWLCAFIALQAAWCFVTAAWQPPGTRTFDLDLTRSVFDTPATRQSKLAWLGVDDLLEPLLSADRHPRVLGLAPDPEMFWLPVRYENLLSISYSRPEYFDNEEAFGQLLKQARVDFVLLEHERTATGFGANVLKLLRAQAGFEDTSKFKNERYLLVDTRPFQAQD